MSSATVGQCVVRVDDPVAGQTIVHGRSLLEWLLREFTRFGVTDFLLLGEEVAPGLEHSLPRPTRITLAARSAGAGSGGDLLKVRDQLQDRFLVCASGTMLDWNLAHLLAAAANDGPDAIGRIVTGRTICLFRKALLDHLSPVCSLEADVLPDLAQRGLLRVGDRVPSVGDIPFPFVRGKALFLDRDGVLNIDHGYVGSRDRFEWVDGAPDAIRYATDAGWHVFIVTNQSGVARGFYTEDAVRDLLAWMADEMRRTGGTIDDVRFCPFHPDGTVDGYRQVHPWRKPLPGMVLDLISAWQLDPKRAVMVGDQQTDMDAARAAGVAGHLFHGGNLLEFLRPILDRAA